MVNERVMAEPAVVKEVIEMDVPSADGKVYCPTLPPETKYPESIHGQQQVVMIPTEQAGIPVPDMAMYDGMLNLQSGGHAAAPFYQIVPQTIYYQQPAHHYAPTYPAATATHQPSPTHQPGQQYVPPTTVMLVQMPTNYQEGVSAPVRQHTPIQNVAAVPASFSYHQMPVEYASNIAPAAVTQQQQQQVAPPQPPTGFAPTPVYRPHNRSKTMWTFCQFCLNNKEPEEFYKSHKLQDANNRVTCPVLRAYNCPICNNGGGDKAHTKSYCPELRNRKVLQTGGRRTRAAQAGQHQQQHHLAPRSGHRQMRPHTQQFQTIEQDS